MTVREFYEFMCEKIPPELSLVGDCDGLCCCPDPEREVTNVLIALDATDDVVNEAIEDGADVILTHHPMIYGKIEGPVKGEYHADKIIKLIKNDISVMGFHTRLDAVDGGVNDMLAHLLGLENIEKFGEGNIGRIGDLPKDMTAEELAIFTRDTLGAPKVELADHGRPIRRVAVVGGSGSSEVYAALFAGADAFVTGDLKFHELTDAPDFGMTLIAAGHFYTENPVCARLFELAAEAGAVPTITFSNRIKTV
ncbi:MAG: Nif3-like dinuclear metal center hexameric protein [Ruminococcaceae bacterium]|nr:Nif3-like dinuclear metal center hexameric protein [Oscillospiraceae bacterium]